MMDGKIPTIHIKADSIPEANYKALRAVHEQGYELRTQYDRRNNEGGYVDPPGRDAKVMIEVKNPFAQPRYSPLSYCERGKYIAELLGAKDHLVVPYGELLTMVRAGEEFEATQWPYCYHQRLTAYPVSGETTLNQLEMCVEKLASDPITRRAVAITGVPEIDLFMKADMPCLRELQFRALEDEEGRLVLNTHAIWRSRDLYKAWPDNLIGLTNLIQIEVAAPLAEKTGKEVIIGPYSEANGSLHIYGQDYKDKGVNTFFDTFPDVDSFIVRSLDSEIAKEVEVIDQLKKLKTEETWKFPKEAEELIDKLVEGYTSGKFIV